MTYEGFCKVLIPEGSSGDVSVKRFEVGEEYSIRYFFGGRDITPGQYTKLTRNGHLWMSDTRAEFNDLRRFISRAKTLGGRVLINGLGLGMIVGHLLECEKIEHIDVVEIDEDVVKLVAPAFRDERVSIHLGDAFEFKWPKGTRWNSAWHDIWPDIRIDDLKEHEKLNRKYGRRVDYQECWMHQTLLRYRGEDRTRRWML